MGSDIKNAVYNMQGMGDGEILISILVGNELAVAGYKRKDMCHVHELLAPLGYKAVLTYKPYPKTTEGESTELSDENKHISEMFKSSQGVLTQLSCGHDIPFKVVPAFVSTALPDDKLKDQPVRAQGAKLLTGHAISSKFDNDRSSIDAVFGAMHLLFPDIERWRYSLNHNEATVSILLAAEGDIPSDRLVQLDTIVSSPRTAYIHKITATSHLVEICILSNNNIAQMPYQTAERNTRRPILYKSPRFVPY